jgi:hypothetical protein
LRNQIVKHGTESRDSRHRLKAGMPCDAR